MGKFKQDDVKKYIRQQIFIKKKNKKDVIAGTNEKVSKIPQQQIVIRKDNIKNKIEPSIIKKEKDDVFFIPMPTPVVKNALVIPNKDKSRSKLVIMKNVSITYNKDEKKDNITKTKDVTKTKPIQKKQF